MINKSSKEETPFSVIKELEKQWKDNYKVTISALDKAIILELTKIANKLDK